MTPEMTLTAEASNHDLRDGLIALGVGLMLGLACLGGAIGQSRTAGAGLESIGRNPSAAPKLFTPMLLGLSLIESLVILAWIIAYGLAAKVAI